MASPTTLLLCATRFWSLRGSPTTPTLRAGVRHVVRKQGVTPREIDKAERILVRRGLVELSYGTKASTLRLTPKGLKLTGRACPRIDLPPWDNRAVYKR